MDDEVACAILRIAEGDGERLRIWYDEPLSAFGGATPRELVAFGRKVDLLRYLDSLLAGPTG